jgi:uncharacterized OB-fold protein
VASPQVLLADRWRPGPEPCLLGGRCGTCGFTFLPPRRQCPACGAADPVTVELPREGRVYSYTTVHVSGPYVPAPYTLAYVDLDPGVRVLAPILGGTPTLGETVHLTEWRHLGRDGAPRCSYAFAVKGGHE